MTTAEPEPERITVKGTLRDTARLMRAHPGPTLLPMLVTQLPLVIVTALASAVLYLTVFDDEPYGSGGLFGVEEAGAPLFAFLVVLAVNLIVSVVGQGATIVGVNSALADRPKRLVECLDPAFTRLGALLGITLLIVAVSTALALTIVGLIFVPYLLLRLALSVNALMLEGISPLGSIRQSWQMVRGYLLRLLGIVAFLALLFLPPILFGSIALLAEDSGRNAQITVDTVISILQGAMIVPVAAFTTAVTTVLYVRIRARSDPRARPA